MSSSKSSIGGLLSKVGNDFLASIVVFFLALPPGICSSATERVNSNHLRTVHVCLDLIVNSSSQLKASGGEVVVDFKRFTRKLITLKVEGQQIKHPLPPSSR